MKISEKELETITELANMVVNRNMTVPAILFLEAYRPLSFIGSQAMLVFKPVVSLIRSFKSYDILQKILEERDGIEIVIKEIERIEREKQKGVKNGKV
ncbi:MAG: hypothetical protein M0R46_03880 [Candidatus Muirbacterium halophilum]|nr:hypothetical protein [Candidatus Muirbacterium halophilum]MCK9475031.1 hypothetical protein [Candidatus Muirbacterium halophilum]